MNLIEQLGGYDNAKGIREACIKNGWSTSDVAKGFHIVFTVKDLDSKLLEYRREHGIFERYDQVIRLDIDNKHIYKVRDIYECGSVGIVRHPTPSKPHWTVLTPCHIRHATPQEIAAGHRL